MKKKNKLFVIIILSVFGVVQIGCAVSFLLNMLGIIIIGPPEKPKPDPLPENGIYFCEELNMSIDFTTFNEYYYKDNSPVECITVYGNDEEHYLLEARGSQFMLYKTEFVYIDKGTLFEDKYHPLYMSGEYSFNNGLFLLMPDEGGAYAFTTESFSE